MQTYEFHEAANLFPMMTGAEFDELCADILTYGYDAQFPILTFGGKILDGRNRYAACLKVGIDPVYTEYTGRDTPLTFVTRANLHRRHLTSSQRAAFAVAALPMLEAQARERQATSGAGIYGGKPLHQLIDEAVETGQALDKAAEMFDTNRQYISDAKRISEDDPVLFEQIKVGEITIPQAKKELRPVSYHVSDDSYDWYTPAEYIEAARAVMGSIDLDPASSQEAQNTVNAGQFYTKELDGLDQSWFGNVWLNPPYNMPLIEQFIDTAIYNYRAGNVTSAIILTNNSTDTGWFHKLIDYPVCFTRGRIQFWNGNDRLATRQGQAIFYLGDNPDLFARVFSVFGAVLRKYDN